MLKAQMEMLSLKQDLDRLLARIATLEKGERQ